MKTTEQSIDELLSEEQAMLIFSEQIVQLEKDLSLQIIQLDREAANQNLQKRINNRMMLISCITSYVNLIRESKSNS